MQPRMISECTCLWVRALTQRINLMLPFSVVLAEQSYTLWTCSPAAVWYMRLAGHVDQLFREGVSAHSCGCVDCNCCRTRGKLVASMKAPLHQLMPQEPQDSGIPWARASHVLQASFSDHLHCEHTCLMGFPLATSRWFRDLFRGHSPQQGVGT
jgi:hypothetical protein